MQAEKEFLARLSGSSQNPQEPGSEAQEGAKGSWLLGPLPRSRPWRPGSDTGCLFSLMNSRLPDYCASVAPASVLNRNFSDWRSRAPWPPAFRSVSIWPQKRPQLEVGPCLSPDSHKGREINPKKRARILQIPMAKPN